MSCVVVLNNYRGVIFKCLLSCLQVNYCEFENSAVKKVLQTAVLITVKSLSGCEYISVLLCGSFSSNFSFNSIRHINHVCGAEVYL